MSTVITLDLEGVLVPEIWINVAERTGIEELRLTTRDISDYDVLMRHRLKVMAEHDLKLSDIQETIAGMGPMPGAQEFLNWIRERAQLIILSDTFAEFAKPLMRQLGWPTLFCHNLEVSDDRVVGYQLRLPDQKRRTVQALHELNFEVLAAGDSYNDVNMLLEADAGVLFQPPANVVDEFPQLPVAADYQQLKAHFESTGLV